MPVLKNQRRTEVLEASLAKLKEARAMLIEASSGMVEEVKT
jgi:hypothetical protein